MQELVGKQFSISGMIIEVLDEESDKFRTRNITTGDIVYLDKAVLISAIKLAKAEEITPHQT